MVQSGIAHPQRAITEGCCPAVSSVKTSEFGWRIATATEKEFIAAKQSPFYASQKKKKKAFSRVFKGKYRNKAGILRPGWRNMKLQN